MAPNDLTPRDDLTLRELFARVIDNAKAYVRAEIAVVKATASVKLSQFAPAVGLIVAAVLIVQAAITVLVAALGMALALWVGTAGGLALGALIALMLATLLAWIAVRRISGSGA